MQNETAKVILGYGDSGLYKSANARFFAKWLYSRTGLPVRLVSAEASSKLHFEDLIEAEIVQALWMVKVKNPLELLRRVTAGFWPFVSGTGPKGNHTVFAPLGPNQISGYIFEGLTTFAESVLEDLREKQRKIAEDIVGKFEEGCDCGSKVLDQHNNIKHKADCQVQKFGAAGRAHYGFTQMEMIRSIRATSMLPVNRVLWTAHEAKSEEEGSHEAIRGPGLVGNKKVGSIQKYVGTLLHFDAYPVEDIVGPEKLKIIRNKVRVWFQRHPDMKYPNISYPAKTTIPSDKVPELEKAFPGGYFEPTLDSGLDKFLDVEARLMESSTEAAVAWKSEIDVKHESTKGESNV